MATRLSGEIAELGPFELLTHGDELPVFAFKVQGRGRQLHRVRRLGRAARARLAGPAYTFPANRTDLAALRVVVRQGFSHDLGDLLISDLKRQLPRLQKQPEPVHGAAEQSFHH